MSSAPVSRSDSGYNWVSYEPTSRTKKLVERVSDMTFANIKSRSSVERHPRRKTKGPLPVATRNVGLCRY